MKELKVAGKKTICTREIIDSLVSNILLGITIKDSVKLTGIGKSSYYDWAVRGREELKRIRDNPGSKVKPREKIFLEFAEAVDLANIKRERRLLSQIHQAATGGVSTQETTSTKRTYKDGSNFSEEKVVTKVTPADWRAAQYLLQVSHRGKYDPHIHVTTAEEAVKPHLPDDYTFEEAVEQFKERLVNQGALPDKAKDDDEAEPKIIDLPSDT